MPTNLSVVIPTYNPRPDYLERTLHALRQQSLPVSAWELVVVDNASNEPVAPRIDVSWHPNAQVLREDRRGRSHALVCGFRVAQGETLVGVDDDNVLHPDYLRIAHDFAENRPWLGAWGSGRIVAEFEAEPDQALEPYLGRLALRQYEQERWSNNVDDWPATPVGAGLCVRRPVAEYWANRVEGEFSPTRFVERRGGEVMGGEDIIMALSARHFGLGWGTSPALAITHLIPARRVTKKYLLEITEGNITNSVLIRSHTARVQPRPTPNLKLVYRVLKLLSEGRLTDIEFLRVRERGIRHGYKLLTSRV